MSYKFKKGDRVRVIKTEEGDSCTIGQVGTVLDNCFAPWVEFDTPTTYDLPVFEDGKLIGLEGYCDCLPEGRLELVEPDNG